MQNKKTIEFSRFLITVNKCNCWGFTFGIHKDLIYIQINKHLCKLEW